jgi:hypothetical protein
MIIEHSGLVAEALLTLDPGTVFKYSDHIYIKTDETDHCDDTNHLCVRLSDGFIARPDRDAKVIPLPRAKAVLS